MINIRRTLSAISAFLVFVLMAGSSVSAAEAEEETRAESDRDTAVTMDAGDFLVETDAAGSFKYEEGRLYIYGGTVSVRNRIESESTDDRIEISGNAVVILKGVDIEAADGAAVTIHPGAYAEIRLEGDGESENERDDEEADLTKDVYNYLRGAEGFAGIEVGTLPGGSDMPALSSSLRITGGGHLMAEGGYGGAAIGGSRGQYACGIISIEGGHITAVAGRMADAVGCGYESEAGITYLPVISDEVLSLTAAADGNGEAISSQSIRPGLEEEEADDFEHAAILRGIFAEDIEGVQNGLTGIRIRSTQGNGEVVLDLPAGYRSFAVKTEDDSEQMIEQGGRCFASQKEDEDGEDILFKPVRGKDSGIYTLAPVTNAPAVDIDVTGAWQDGDNKDGMRPDSVIVTLYANGRETGRTLTLSSENGWQGTFDGLAVYADAARQSYSVVEEGISGYTVTVCGSDRDGYTITNIHEPLPEGRGIDEAIADRKAEPKGEGTIVATVVTSKVTRSMPVRTSTTIHKTRSAKTADSADTILWGAMLLVSVAAISIWMHFEQKKD